MKQEEYFTVDGAYLKQQAKYAFMRFTMYFNPVFWVEFAEAKGAKAKFNVWLDWPEPRNATAN